MSLLFGGDANGALDYTNGILGTIASDWTTVDFDDTTPAAIDGATSAAAGMSINTLDIKGFDAAAMGEALKLVDAGLKAMTSVAAKLGSISTRIDLQTDFVSKLSELGRVGIGKLVDADMEEESSSSPLSRRSSSSLSSRCRSPTPRRRTSCRSSVNRAISSPATGQKTNERPRPVPGARLFPFLGLIFSLG